jgi:nucleolar protein 4
LYNLGEEPAFKKLKWEKGHDISENKTVFIRNLSFNTEEEDLKDMMVQTFGRVIFARLVIDKETDYPKGMTSHK